MTIEATLESIDTTLKALLAATQSGVQMTAVSESTDTAAASKRSRRTKEEIAADKAAEEAAAAAALAAKEKELSDNASAIAAANAAKTGSATAGAVSGAAGEVTWDQAVAALKSLTSPENMAAHGATAVKAIVTQFDPTAANVPALKALNKNAEIIAAVQALLNPAATAAAGDDIFG